MQMKNYEIESFYNFLMDFELVGKQSRMRTKFCKILGLKREELEQDRIALVKDFAKKDDAGEFVKEIGNDGNERYVMADMESFDTEYRALQTEDFNIHKNLDNEEMINTVSNIVLNSQKIYSGQGALTYDRFCEICESD